MNNKNDRIEYIEKHAMYAIIAEAFIFIVTFLLVHTISNSMLFFKTIFTDMMLLSGIEMILILLIMYKEIRNIRKHEVK